MVLVVVVDCDLLFWVCGRSRWVYGFGYGFGSLFFFFGFMADPEGLWWFVVLGFWW